MTPLRTYVEECNSVTVTFQALNSRQQGLIQVAGPRVCNTLPEETTSAPLLACFCQRLKTSLFRNLIYYTTYSTLK